MKGHDADWAVKRCTYLSSTEKAVFWALLVPADYDTCVLPERFTPSLGELSRWTSLGVSSVKRALRHLAEHGWVLSEAGSGRGHKSSYRLAPGTPDADCHCEKGATVTPLRVAKGVTVDTFQEEKGPTVDLEGAHCGPRRGPNDSEDPQVKTAFARREAGKQGQVVPGCDRCSSSPARVDNGGNRFCASCAPHLFKESA